jgi:hypothetical protein
MIMTHKQQGFSALYVFLIVLVLLLLGFAGWYVWSQQEDDSAETTTSEAVPVGSDDSAPAEESALSPESELVVDETDDYTLSIPAGFERVGERIFTFTGAPERTYSYQNSTTGDYFEVNVTPADSGLNADFVWTYTYAGGVFTLDKSDSTVCMPADDEWCEFSGGNGRLDSAIFAQPEAPINGERIYFTFGNTTSETVGDLSYVDAFLENIEF